MDLHVLKDCTASAGEGAHGDDEHQLRQWGFLASAVADSMLVPPVHTQRLCHFLLIMGATKDSWRTIPFDSLTCYESFAMGSA